MGSEKYKITEKLLTEVSRLLEAKEAEFDKKATSAMKVQEFLSDAAVGLNELIPNQASILFTTIHALLVEDYNCSSSSEPISNACKWPCQVDYVNKPESYTYWESTFEVSVLSEQAADSDRFYHILFEFPSNKFAYFVQPLNMNLVPRLGPNQTMNMFKLKEIIVKVANIITRHINPFIMSEIDGKKFRCCDFSTHGIEPNLKIAEYRSLPAKRRKIDPAQETLAENRSNYGYLKRLLSKETNPSKPAILFGILYELMAKQFGCKKNSQEEKWPCPPSYCSEVVKIEVPTGRVLTNSSGQNEAEYLPLKMSLLVGYRDYFLNLRDDKKENYTCQKITAELVPTFMPENITLDKRKIELLLLFTISLYEKFVTKVLKGTFRSLLHSSRTSMESSAADSCEEEDYSAN